MAGKESTYRLSDAALEALERSGWIEGYLDARQRFIDQGHTEGEWEDLWFDFAGETTSQGSRSN
jgi:hypothetical protein